MKLKKKTILFASTALFAMNIFAVNSLALSMPQNLANDQEVVARAEETEWVYRYNNGKYQKRLWSNTYQKWLTDWIDCK
ncbi:MAG: hypothetical protein GXY01_10030 [Clostridiales bacterium]|jgi:hypothetical protein|nr:hypothetical protein [Clostridiales bacterium]